MRPRTLLAFIGFLLIIIGTYCPLLRPFGLFSWDIYGLNKPYGIAVFVVAIAGLASAIAGQVKLAKVSALLSLVLIILLYIAAIMKVNTSFSFIPFKKISAGLSHMIKYKWGWYVLFAGAIISVISTLGAKQKVWGPQYQAEESKEIK
ncbi:hypothetical protein [Mucilaginibacter sp. KACC 22063]|uniref:hypothetical protein n=1 Tax=Mucilaginibacter sp. KACC 22063 TaxID=3025666 RepID=UPI00236614AC|nr:hypothetical protein [Mucilaginibacter sp. KACC 22063]WDF57062.1 hypothetical protein PQ461_08340 [Mucilaginibacter sp. KACC 22063]